MPSSIPCREPEPYIERRASIAQKLGFAPPADKAIATIKAMQPG